LEKRTAAGKIVLIQVLKKVTIKKIVLLSVVFTALLSNMLFA
jgi:hypothetical protein